MPEEKGRQYIDWKKVYIDYGGLEIRMTHMNEQLDSESMDGIW